MIELTETQRLAIVKGQPIHVSDPQMGQDLVILSAAAFASLQEQLRDEKEQKAFRAAGLRSAERWMKENPY
jgi:hypothetical protein